MLPILNDGSTGIQIYASNISVTPLVTINSHETPGVAKDKYEFIEAKTGIINITGFIPSDANEYTNIEKFRSWYESNTGNDTGSLSLSMDMIGTKSCYISKFDDIQMFRNTSKFEYTMQLTLLEPLDIIINDPEGGLFLLVATETWENAPEPLWDLIATETWES
jgi:hypothetical protein